MDEGTTEKSFWPIEILYVGVVIKMSKREKSRGESTIRQLPVTAVHIDQDMLQAIIPGVHWGRTGRVRENGHKGGDDLPGSDGSASQCIPTGSNARTGGMTLTGNPDVFLLGLMPGQGE